MEAILSDRSRFIKTHLSQFGPKRASFKYLEQNQNSSSTTMQLKSNNPNNIKFVNFPTSFR